MQCFPAIMSGSHVLASAPTGSGKTIAFLGPILALLAKPGKEFARALVVDPSRELAKQTLDEFAKLTSGRKWNGRLVDKLSDKSNIKRLDVAVATPLRLVQLLRDNRISLDSTKHLVFDEADKLLDLGFAPQVDELLAFCPKDKGRLMQTMMFSATLPPVVVDLAGSILTSPLRISIGDVNAAAPDVEQTLIEVRSFKFMVSRSLEAHTKTHYQVCCRCLLTHSRQPRDPTYTQVSHVPTETDQGSFCSSPARMESSSASWQLFAGGGG